MTMSPVLTFSQQSMYDIVNNLGSLAARSVLKKRKLLQYAFFIKEIYKKTIFLNENTES